MTKQTNKQHAVQELPGRLLTSFKSGASTLSRLPYVILVISVLLGTSFSAQAQATNETISSGSFIIDMGGQKVDDALRPYGMVYDLLENFQVPIKWVINPSKVRNGNDFVYNGKGYEGGPFIVPAEFRTPAVNTRITFWETRGVKGVTTTSPVVVPVYTTLFNAPSWTINSENSAIAERFFSRAEVPTSAYDDKLPAALGPCDDVFVMPHADPKWNSHKNLIDWNRDFQGSIWYGCHSGSALENMFNPASPTQQANFLAEKTGTAVEVDNDYAQNTLILWTNHDDNDGTPPFTYDYPADPVMQFKGDQDDASRGGSEQIFIPLSAGWRPSTRVGVYDPDNVDRVSNNAIHHAGVLVWGRGFGDPNNGWVLMQGGHDIGASNGGDFVNAQRSFFNFSFLAMQDKVVIPSVAGVTTNTSIAPGEPINLSFTVPPPNNAADFTVQWSSSCGGTFSPNATAQAITFTPPNSGGSTTCVITLVITDPCGRKSFDSESVPVECDLQVTTDITNICSGAGAVGAIGMTLNYAGPYDFSWTRTGGGSGSGTGSTISGLSAGTYNVTVTSANDCFTSFTATVNQFSALNITTDITAVACFGANTGDIDLSVSGGTPAYTYAWNDGATSPTRSGIPAGTYTVTVTDVEGCTAVASATVTQPAAPLNAVPTVSNVDCFGESTGSITLSVSGGTLNYTYLWNDGATTQNRSNLAAGTYAVTVTDANSCTLTRTNLTVTQPASALSLIYGTPMNAECGSINGSLTITGTGGTGPYTYDWSGTPTGDGTPTITGLGAGTYAVTVSDVNGCTIVGSRTIIQTQTPVLSLVPNNPTCPPTADPPVNSDGSIDLTVTGGTPGFTYAWTTTGGSGLNPTAQDQTGLTAGTYNVTVTDANTCTASTTVTLVFENQLPITPGGINNN